MFFDFAALDGQNRYKLLTSTVVPRPIAWVVTLDADGKRNAAPYSFFNALCGDPPTIGVSMGSRDPATQKDSRLNIRATGEFVVNLVADENARAMNVTAIEFAHEIDEIAEAGLSTLPSSLVRPPRIAESPVALECRFTQEIVLGPANSLMLGHVVAMHIRDDAVLDPVRCHIDTPKLGLLGRMHGGGWYARTTDRFEMARIPVGAWKRD